MHCVCVFLNCLFFKNGYFIKYSDSLLYFLVTLKVAALQHARKLRDLII